MKSAGDGIRTGDSSPIKDGAEIDELTAAFEVVDPNSASQNVYTALMLLLQAVKMMPQVFKVASFALSLFFLALWLNPLGSLFGKISPAKKSSVSHHSSHNKERS